MEFDAAAQAGAPSDKPACPEPDVPQPAPVGNGVASPADNIVASDNLDYSFSVFTPGWIRMDSAGVPHLVRKALSNLLDNAIKYSEQGDVVVVELREKTRGWEISFQNSGPGIPQSEIENIWEPFYRGTNAAVCNVDGRGLGLVVVRRSVELCGGKVAVSSSEQGPTVFTVWLPTAER